MEEKKNNNQVEETNIEETKEEKVETIDDRLNKKRMVIITIISVGVFLFIIVSFFSNVIVGLFRSSEIPKYVPKTEQKSIVPNVNEDWKTMTERRINNIEDELKKIKENNKEIMQALQEQKKERQQLLDKITQKIEEVKSSIKNNIPAPPIEYNSKPIPPPTTTQQTQTNETSNTQEKQKKPTLKEFKPSKRDMKSAKKVAKQVNLQEKKSVKIKLPLGFIKGLTLTGLDAPTFQYGQNNPHPILMVSLSREILANNKNLNLKECFFLGSGYGEISSERAYIRLVKISCIDKKGNVIEQKINGWVLDSDGKVGLRGRVVSKQGAVLAKSFMAGLLEGLSRTIAASSTTIQISPVGTTQTLKPEDISKVALASGFESAASRLAQFYMKIAEQMYPVVEVSPGRKITILIQGGNVEKDTKYKLITNPTK